MNLEKYYESDGGEAGDGVTLHNVATANLSGHSAACPDHVDQLVRDSTAGSSDLQCARIASQVNNQAVADTVDNSGTNWGPVRYRNRSRSEFQSVARTSGSCHAPLDPNDKVASSAEWSQSFCSFSEEGAAAGAAPPGWEKHQDGDGAYFWHVKSGTIQREPPVVPALSPDPGSHRQQQRDSETSSGISSGSAASGITRSRTSFGLATSAGALAQHTEKRRGAAATAGRPVSLCAGSSHYGIDSSAAVRFSVYCLGWCPVEEHCLTAELSSRTVNRCIVDLAQGGGHITADGVGRWGDGKALLMEFDQGCLRLLEPDTLSVINSQPIHSIRVWGVGRDNAKDFAYVARDLSCGRHVCHVFRCELPARLISNTLRDICKQIMIERSVAQAQMAQHDSYSRGVCDVRHSNRTRPVSLILHDRHTSHVPKSVTSLSLNGISVASPQTEPCQVLTALYMGSVSVSRPSGIDVLNAALDKLVAIDSQSRARWPLVNVSVTPSTITVRHHHPPLSGAAPLLQCRVRFLSFLGIGREVEHCGVVVHSAEDVFVAHGFHCHTSAGPLCRAVETACQLRYQKCLDGDLSASSRPGLSSGEGATSGGLWQRSRLRDTLKSMLGALAGHQRVTASQS